MEDKLDILLETVEILTQDINKVTFDLEGLREDYDDMEKNRPFLVRQMSLNNIKTNRLIRKLEILQHDKVHASADLGTAQMELKEKANIEEKVK